MSQRVLHIVSGLAVLVTSFIFGHLVHHALFVHRAEISAGWLIGYLSVAGVIGLFSFAGAFLLLTGGRSRK